METFDLNNVRVIKLVEDVELPQVWEVGLVIPPIYFNWNKSINFWLSPQVHST